MKVVQYLIPYRPVPPAHEDIREVEIRSTILAISDSKATVGRSILGIRSCNLVALLSKFQDRLQRQRAHTRAVRGVCSVHERVSLVVFVAVPCCTQVPCTYHHQHRCNYLRVVPCSSLDRSRVFILLYLFRTRSVSDQISYD